MAEQPSAKLNIDAVSGVSKDVGAQNAENRLECRYGQQADDKDIEGAETAMHQDLVDDDLKEQRRDQGKELQKERNDQHPGEDAAILVDGADKPGDIEAAGQIEQPGAAGQQHELAVPGPFELGLRHQNGTRRQRPL